MLENLKDRGCELKGIEACPNEEAQIQRMNTCLAGDDAQVEAECYSMNIVYDSKLDAIEKKRIESLEIFDEFEEWVLLQSHYCLCFGKRYLPSAQNVAANISI